uniref:Transposase (putative) gypsy type domain-containing protein n=1 Tax=Oryza sativa subsp. japonica TaxID=39947 RepID=Q33AU6_ORYSJ|nr:hypothetical protein LOC_Os10g08130 [Oryza sativa Japonica Group]
MAPRKPNPASVKGPDPGRIDDDTTAYLGISLMDDGELAKLVSSGALVEGQAFTPGKAVVPKPVDNRMVVFTVFFEAGLRFPCNVLLPEILRLFQVELPQLSPSALVRIAIFDWACRTSGFEPSAELFGAIFFAIVNSKMVITSARTKTTVFGSMNFNVRPERSDLWPAAAQANRVYNGELLPRADPHKADDDVGPSRKRTHGQVKLAPRKRRVPASSDSDTDDKDDVEEHDGGGRGRKGQGRGGRKPRRDPGYTPTPSLGHNETGVESNSSPLHRKDLERAKVLVAFSAGKGKVAAIETSASEYSLAAPHFAPGDFETRADLIPFVEGVSNLVLPASTLSLFTELNEFDEGCSTIKSLLVRILAAYCSTERTVRARLDGFRNRLQAKDDEIGRKSLEMEALANTLKEAKAENKRLQTELEKGKEARAEVDCLKAELEKGKEARAEVDRLKAELKKEKAHSAALTDYYNLTEPKMEALRLEVSKAEASAAKESQQFSREMAKATESARTVCQTLRLALSDMGVKQFGCEHVAEFPNYAKRDWEVSAQDVSPALRAWRKQFWQKDGGSTAKTRLLEQLAEAEAADRCEEEDAAAGGVGGDA